MLERSLHSLYSIIGREHELNAIETALSAPPFQQVLFFEGQGGIGKTRLLAETRDRARQFDHILTTDILDLYLTRHHQPLGIMQAIVDELQASLRARGITEDVFPGYTAASTQFVAALYDSTDLDHTRSLMVDEVFLAEYARLAERYSLVLLIDTFEKLHPEIIEVEAFNFRQTSRLESWLVNLLARLPNTLVLLAGRPRPKQHELLANVLGERLVLFSVEPFTLDETRTYVDSSLAEMEPPVGLSDETIAALHYASAGRPVVLSIALACAQVYAFDIEALPPGFEEQYPANQARLSDDFVNLVISDLQINHPELADLLTKAVYLRKGLRPELLARLSREEHGTPNSSELQEHLQTFSQLSFVKPISEDQMILHDEMYELLFGKLNERATVRWFQAAIAVIDEQLQASNNLAQGRSLQTLQVERLFYQMALDTRLGYQQYRELSNNAIQAHDEDFDTQLQDEIARFFDEYTSWGRFYRRRLALSGLSWDQIVFDEGVRWVYRCIASPLQGARRYSDAVEIANRVREHFPDMYASNQLARCDLEVAQLQAEVYVAETTPRGADIIGNYHKVVAELQDLQRSLGEADPDNPARKADLQHARFIEANAYNYWGYFDRINGRLHSAIEKYKRAVRLFKGLGPEVDNLRATTLNNLGFALSKQGDSRRGLEFVQNALTITEAQGSNFRIATTLNTLAQVQMDLGQVDTALENVIKARKLFEDLDSTRGLALCALAEGRVRNRVAGLWQDALEQEREYARASASYERASTLFDTFIEGELTRRIESRMWRATVFRDWGTARYRRGESGDEQMQIALQLLLEARSLTTPATPAMILAHIQESIAVVYVNQQRYDEALDMLQQARATIPEEYDILPGFGVTNTPRTRELRIYWLRLSQVELQVALCYFGKQQYQPACVHLLRAIACLLTFSPDSAVLGTFRMLGKRELARITDEQQLETLRRNTLADGQELRIERAALVILEEIFDEVVEDLDFF